MTTAKRDFKVVLLSADHKAKTKGANKVADPRSPVARLFTNLDQETGAIAPKEVAVLDCANGTPKDQGMKYDALNGKIPVFLRYKENDKEFDSDIKGRHCVIIGSRPGKPGLMIPVEDLPEFIAEVSNLNNVLGGVMPEALKAIGVAPAPRQILVQTPAPVQTVDLTQDALPTA